MTVKVGVFCKGFLSENKPNLDSCTERIQWALKKAGYEINYFVQDDFLLDKLKKSNIDIFFNNYSVDIGKDNQAAITTILELSSIPYTGSSPLTHYIGIYKHIAKKIFSFHGIKTPRFQVFDNINQPLSKSLNFPLIVKPVHEGSSVGISQNSIITGRDELKQNIAYILENYNQNALVEEFIEGREFTVGVLGNENPLALPVVEIDFGKEKGFYSRNIKSRDSAPTICPAKIDSMLAERISQLAISAFKAINCRDYARIDIRQNNKGELFVLEINTLPGLDPDYSDFPKAARAAGITYDKLIKKIVDLGLKRSFKKRSLNVANN
ncbi:MAG: D-alanine-D-alanine ligase [Thermosediminibacterales bacterium]|nr:D-alanine-D-alanine ligase [Thermosediminibacterales bacterium]